MLKIVGAVLGCAVSLLAMHEVEINLNNYDLDAKVNFDAGQFNSSIDPDTVFFGGRYLHASHQHSDDLLDKDYDLVDGHFFVRQRLAGAQSFSVGMGGKFVYTSIESSNFYALPLGVLARYDLPLDIAVPIAIGGEFYFAPEVLTWDEAKNYLEYDVYVEAMLIDRAGLTAGFRSIETDFEKASKAFIFNQTWFVGVKFRF